LNVLDLAFHKHSIVFRLNFDGFAQFNEEPIFIIGRSQGFRQVPPIEVGFKLAPSGVEGCHHPEAAGIVNQFSADFGALNAGEFTANQHQNGESYGYSAQIGIGLFEAEDGVDEGVAAAVSKLEGDGGNQAASKGESKGLGEV
jgi:hypothetical protein